MNTLYYNHDASRACRERLFLLTNGLGGYSSVTESFGAPRADQGILVAAVKAPNVRINLVHRISESLIFHQKEIFLSAQTFADGTPAERGDQYLQAFSCRDVPLWHYEADGVRVMRQCAMQQQNNTVAVLYSVENTSAQPCILKLTPYCKFAPKELALEEAKELTFQNGQITDGEYRLFVRTDAELQPISPQWQTLAYPEDAKDGRPGQGKAGACCRITMTVRPGQKKNLQVIFSTEETDADGWELLGSAHGRAQRLMEQSGLTDPVARRLTVAADAYISHRDSTGGKTILAGYPLFSDWGRDTMIALPGCCLSTGRYEDAKSILRTFLAYERDGLVPNLFPEGDQAPMYNTVDAALLLIDAVWHYVKATNDWAFAWEAWDPMDRIICHYRKGTHHGIGMDEDGLIYAGQGLDQVTWMDVCVDGVLPTPRHGKPVEINAYWYNALRIMDEFAKTLGHDEKDFAQLAQQVKKSFVEKFYLSEEGYLKDVLSDTEADLQIRCNQIWALAMPYTMLTHQQAQKVLHTVTEHLYTPFGLRTLSPKDPQYQPHYGGTQFRRDMAYHQGTTWVFPMGAYYRAMLKLEGREGLRRVRQGLENVEAMLDRGCVGQLPEIYDGDHPAEGKGCFAQAWSVGELLRVYEAIETMEKETHHEAE